MSKTITIIELLNKMAKKEELPNEIRYRNCMFYITEGAGISPDYVNDDHDFILEYISNEADSLNEIIEILDNEETIDIDSISELVIQDHFSDYDNRDIEINRMKINELLKAVKQINKKEK